VILELYGTSVDAGQSTGKLSADFPRFRDEVILCAHWQFC
jgi:hypothetical protein